MILKEYHPDERPHEKLVQKGSDALSTSELLALILRTGTHNENVLELSNRLLSRGVGHFTNMSYHELIQVRGIGPAKAAKLCSLFALRNRLKEQKIKKNHLINSADDVFEYARVLQNKEKECFMVIFLDSRNSVIKNEIIATGILDAVIIHPREIFKGAIRATAKSIIAVHNHPSGDSRPSNEDDMLTEKLKKASTLVDIPLLDHVIIGTSYYSYKKEKRL